MNDVKILTDIRKAVEKIEIKKRGTPEGELQRESFRRRWGKRPEQLWSYRFIFDING